MRATKAAAATTIQEQRALSFGPELNVQVVAEEPAWSDSDEEYDQPTYTLKGGASDMSLLLADLPSQKSLVSAKPTTPGPAATPKARTTAIAAAHTAALKQSSPSQRVKITRMQSHHRSAAAARVAAAHGVRRNASRQWLPAAVGSDGANKNAPLRGMAPRIAVPSNHTMGGGRRKPSARRPRSAAANLPRDAGAAGPAMASPSRRARPHTVEGTRPAVGRLDLSALSNKNDDAPPAVAAAAAGPATSASGTPSGSNATSSSNSSKARGQRLRMPPRSPAGASGASAVAGAAAAPRAFPRSPASRQPVVGRLPLSQVGGGGGRGGATGGVTPRLPGLQQSGMTPRAVLRGGPNDVATPRIAGAAGGSLSTPRIADPGTRRRGSSASAASTSSAAAAFDMQPAAHWMRVVRNEVAEQSGASPNGLQQGSAGGDGSGRSIGSTGTDRERPLSSASGQQATTQQPTKKTKKKKVKRTRLAALGPATPRLSKAKTPLGAANPLDFTAGLVGAAGLADTDVDSPLMSMPLKPFSVRDGVTPLGRLPHQMLAMNGSSEVPTSAPSGGLRPVLRRGSRAQKPKPAPASLRAGAAAPVPQRAPQQQQQQQARNDVLKSTYSREQMPQAVLSAANASLQRRRSRGGDSFRRDSSTSMSASASASGAPAAVPGGAAARNPLRHRTLESLAQAGSGASGPAGAGSSGSIHRVDSRELLRSVL